MSQAGGMRTIGRRNIVSGFGKSVRVTSVAGVILILLQSSGCQRRQALTPTETVKEFERLYKDHDISRQELLSKALKAKKMDISSLPDSAVTNPGGLAYVDSVFQNAKEYAGRGLEMGLAGEKVDGDKAEVIYSLRGDPQLDLTNTITLVKEDGGWKIDGVEASATGHPSN